MARPRIIVATPDPAECEVLAGWLAADGFEPIKCTTLASAAAAVETQTFEIFVADFTFAFRHRLHEVSRRRVRDQKTPTIVIGDLEVPEQAKAEGRRVMYVSRPVEQAALMCLVSMAVFDGRPGRRSPRKNISKLAAVVNAGPSHILDVSLEGLRLAMPKDGRPSPPPAFNVGVPMTGLTVTVKRMWVRATAGSLLCGVAVADPGREKAWRLLVDTLPAVDDATSDVARAH
jgi:hypothetical protein